MEMKSKRNGNIQMIAVICILISGCLWGTMGLWVRRLSGAGFSSIQILAIKNLFAVIWMALFFLIYDRKLFILHLKDIWCFIGTGILSLVFFGYCYNQTIILTSLSVAAILLYTAPIFVTIMSCFLFKESFTGFKLLALCLAFGGCILVTGLLSSDHAITMTGLMTGLGSGFGYALYSIFSRYALQRAYHPFSITFYTFVFSMFALSVLSDWKPIISYVSSDIGNLLFCIIFSLTTGVLPYIFYTFGLSYVDNGKASIMATIEPVVATLIGVIVLGENMTLMNGIGVLAVLGAVTLLNLH